MSNYVIVWNSWIFRSAKVAGSGFMAGHTASELEAFERAMAKTAPNA